MARIANKGAVAEMEQSARQVFHHFHFITLSFSLPVLIAIQEEEKFLFFSGSHPDQGGVTSWPERVVL